MNNKLLEKLIRYPSPYLTRTELAVLIDRSPNACDAIIKRAIQSGYLIRLRRGLYIISSIAGADKPDSRELAQFIYGPSYISFESALSWHSWIPEGVRILTSASIKRKKEVSTPIATFVYERIPSAVFSIGVRHIKTPTGSFLMADAWKALADLIYVRGLSWPNISHISEDLRIEPESFIDFDLELLELLSKQYPNRQTRHYLNLYYQELKS